MAHPTRKTTRHATEIQAEFQGRIGIQQSAGVTFAALQRQVGRAYSGPQGGSKIGRAWAGGSAQAALQNQGIDLELEAAAAFGCELNIDGDCTWKLADHGLDLSGNCKLFAGANGN